MAGNSIDVFGLVSPDQIASKIAFKWDQWKDAMRPFLNEALEARDYLYATDTKTTTNAKLPFKNSTTTPKLAQLSQNLKANYTSHLFSNRDWINWEAANDEAALVEQRRAIEAYVRTKARLGKLEDAVSLCLDDWIGLGVCFAGMRYVNEFNITPSGERIVSYSGPKLFRISPHDIVFNIAASSWERAPKIIRSLQSFGELARSIEEEPENAVVNKEILARLAENRRAVRATQRISKSDTDKSRGLVADGFGDITEYYQSELVEVLEYYGDWYDMDTGEFSKNCIITVVDRAYVVRKEAIDNWTGRPYLYYSSWRQRPDNLYGIGPLAPLIGMQYKIDKLENLRADIFDQIAQPTVVESGDVEFFGVRGAPGGRYVTELGGSVNFLRPDATALNADLQIAQTMALMEELAGAPREAMGFRTPGEKTRFEVQVLDNAANRIFRDKAFMYERNFLNVILNDMVELARRNLDGVDLVRMEDSTFGAQQFLEVTRDDLMASGRLYASGTSHFERQANTLQNLNLVFNSQIGAKIDPHISSKKLAMVVEDLISAEGHSIVSDNIGVIEQIETARIQQAGAQSLQEEAVTPADINGEPQ